MKTAEITNSANMIDSRDVIARIDWLEGTDDEEERAELAALKSLAEEASNYAADWEYGEILIRESYFTEYAAELLKDMGVLPNDLPWYVEIDWETTAGHIQQDYTAVDFNGVTYYVR